MTWIDFVIIALFVLFVVGGARFGSLWTGACIIGGFLGAALVDIYTLPLSGLMGGFPGSTVLAALALYAAGLGAVLIPGAVLSQISSVFLLSLIDGAFGLITGAFAAMLLVSILLLATTPLITGFESSRAFRNSAIARPLYRTLEEVTSHLPYKNTREKLKTEATEKITDLTKGVADTVKSLKK